MLFTMNLKKMVSQHNLLCEYLYNRSDPRLPLLCYAKLILWQIVNNHIWPPYATSGPPDKLARLVAGHLIFRLLERLSDERNVEACAQPQYLQTFCAQQWATLTLPYDHHRGPITYAAKKKVDSGRSSRFPRPSTATKPKITRSS